MAQTPTASSVGKNRSPASTPGVRGSRIPSFIRPSLAGNHVTSQRESSSPYTPKTILQDKPLPPRPVASVVGAPSPSKDSRGLIDASEKPLQSKWPALQPRSVSAPEQESSSPCHSSKLTTGSIPRKSIRNNAASTTAGDLSKVTKTCETRDSKLSVITRCSSTPSFVSALDNEPITSQSANAPEQKTRDSEDSIYDTHLASSPPSREPPPIPVRTDSLQTPSCHVSGGLQKVFDTPPAALHKDVFSQGTGRTTTHSESHKVTPANFSRPRPSSGLYSSDGAHTSSSRTEHFSCRPKTASRIPISGLKKPTLIDIPNPSASGHEDQKPALSPSYGAQRLISPGALKILDEGAKRRWLKQGNTGTSTASTASSGAEDAARESCPTLTQTRHSTPDCTGGPSSSDEEEAQTPDTQTCDLHLNSHVNHDRLLAEPKQRHEKTLRIWEEDESRLIRAPPSRSPYTVPLQTIPSQTILPAHSDSITPPASDEITKSMDLADLVQEYSDFNAERQSGHAAHGSCSSRSVEPLQSVSPTVTYGCKDEPIPSSECEYYVVAAQKNAHRTRTLSQLEGQSTPPTKEVAREAVSEFFEDKLTLSAQRRVQASKVQVPRESTLLDKMATAQRYLDQNGDSTASSQVFTDSCGPQKIQGQTDDTANPTAAAAVGTAQGFPLPSKWSGSTPSALGHSAGPSGNASSLHLQVQREEPPCSIGFPSSTACPEAQSNRTAACSVGRLDSPTLGKGLRKQKRAPGSITRAREEIPGRYKGYACQTLSTQTKQNSKSRESSGLPVPSNGSHQRGRRSNTDDSKMQSGVSGVPQSTRSRSKSRLVLAKLNGFFSGRREKKTAPPLPAIPPDVPASSSHDHSQRTAATMGSQSQSPRSAIPSNATAKPPVAHPDLVPSSLLSITPEGDESVECEHRTGTNKGMMLIEKLRTKAQLEKNLARKSSLLHISHTLNMCMTHANEAQISAEKAQQAAREARTWAEICMKGAIALQKAARVINESRARRG